MSYWIPIPGMMKGIRVEMVPVSKKRRNRKEKRRKKKLKERNKNDNRISR